jgi:hypothetical protein
MEFNFLFLRPEVSLAPRLWENGLCNGGPLLAVRRVLVPDLNFSKNGV